MAIRIFLGLNVLVWLPYGIYCFASPGALAEIAGVLSTTATGNTELRAMYGGLQFGIGVLCALGLLRPGWQPTALGALACLTAGLGVSRLAGAVLDQAFTQYTVGALVLEFSLASISAYLLASGTAREVRG